LEQPMDRRLAANRQPMNSRKAFVDLSEAEPIEFQKVTLLHFFCRGEPTFSAAAD